jgi:pilus assembly protein CpaB
MWKVKRMNTARIIVLTIALGAGGIAAAYPVSGSDNTPAPTAPAARLQTADMRVATCGIGSGQGVKPERTGA